MSEKNYHEISGERGTIHLSHAVIAEIASIACQETEGVASMAAVPAGSESGVKGIVLTLSDGSCTVDAHITVKMGAIVSQTAENAQQAIKNAVETASGISVAKANVFVAGISLK